MCVFNTIVSSYVNTKVFQNQNKICNTAKMTLGLRIKKAREHANLTRDELADAVGCSYDLLRKLEADLRKSTSFLSKIAKICIVDFNWLETGEGSMLPIFEYQKSQRLEALMKVAQQLPDYALDEVINDAIKTFKLVSKATDAAKKNGTE